MSDVKTLYNEDFFAWTKHQADALRAAARDGSNEPLDWKNLAEEIEDLGKSDRRELRSRLSVIIEHLVKLHYSRARDPRRKWRETILRERAAVERILEDSPSLRREIPAMIDKETDRAADLAFTGLSARGEIARSSRAKPLDQPFSYSPDQILGDWFPPEPKKPTRRAREA
jgi:uncharacterized protein DUF29